MIMQHLIEFNDEKRPKIWSEIIEINWVWDISTGSAVDNKKATK